ncbi:MAG: DUF4157 domain-containing protein [Bacteroidota bacterium]
MRESISPKSAVVSRQHAPRKEAFFTQNRANPFFKTQATVLQKKDLIKRSAPPKVVGSNKANSPQNSNSHLPQGLKNGLEQLSGMAMDDVRVHRNSSKPQALNAHAYAQGTNIYLTQGQEQHLPHEAWHVVQQKQGRVKPTLQLKAKLNINDDVKLEAEADIMGEKAMKMPFKEGARHKNTSIPANQAPIQRRIIGTDNNPLTIDDAITALEALIPENRRQRLKPLMLRRLVQGLVESNIKDFSLEEAAEMLELRNTQLASANAIGPLTTSQPDMIAAPGLKLNKTFFGPSKKAQLGAMISAAGDSHFEEAVEPQMGASSASMTTPGPLAVDPADMTRRAQNLANLMRDLPKIKIKKGTKLLHVTSHQGHWLREGFLGGDKPEGYSFFTLLSRGPANAHTSSVSAALVYTVQEDINAFFLQNYQSVVLNRLITTHAPGDQHSTSSQGGRTNVGGEFAAALLDYLPMDQRIKAFISPSESELAFYNYAIPTLLSRVSLITRKDGGSTNPANILNTETRKVEKLY